jgi:hypothetical protein
VSAPQLPPPPGQPVWGPPSPRPAPSGSLLDRPAWRQGRPGWALLHIAIAFGIAIVAFFVAVIVGMFGRTQAQIDNADDGPAAIGTLLVLGSSIVGWFLFAYLGWSLGRRWTLLGLLVGGSCAVGAILFSVASR